MTLEYQFICPLPNGIHARPASTLEKLANSYKASVSIVNGRTGQKANAKSVLSMIGTDFKLDDPCRVFVSGEDEGAAFERLKLFFNKEFASCDEPLPDLPDTTGQAFLPPSLRNLAFTYYTGTPAAGGIGFGRIVRIGELELPENLTAAHAGDSSKELARINDARRKLENVFASKRTTLSGTEAAVFDAHFSILRDPELYDKLVELVTIQNCSAASALTGVVAYYRNLLKTTQNRLLHERIADIQDVCSQLLTEIYGTSFKNSCPVLAQPSICVAKDLMPSQFMSMDHRYLKGLVLSNAGTTSHTVILARSLGIPVLTGIADSAVDCGCGTEVIIDGNSGIMIPSPVSQVRSYYERRALTELRRTERIRDIVQKQCRTTDGRSLEIAANMARADESNNALANGADGVGLFRTEMVFINAAAMPSEEEQFEIYKKTAQAFAQKPVIIRTLDIGGDKPLACLNLPRETNPFLGYRAVRIYPDHLDMFVTQVRAILRASAYGMLKLMVPMVCSVEEIRWVKQIVASVKQQLDKEDISYDRKIQIGIMIEIPSTAFIIDQLCAEADFFSIGTNDLLQYFLAVDRENAKVMHLYNQLHPSFLRLLKKIIDDARKVGKWVGMCGEMAGNVDYLPLLLGLGLDEISLAPSQIPAMKANLCRITYADCRKLVETVTDCGSIDEVRQTLTKFNQSSYSLQVIDSDLILLDTTCSSKEQVIRDAVDNLYVARRTDNPDAVEEALWKREAVYSTGLGYGFAIPHCKSDAVISNCISVVRLKNGIEWNSIDGEPVDIVIVLAIRESDRNDTHMKIFARLARKIMHEEFRLQMRQASDEQAVLACLKTHLDLV